MRPDVTLRLASREYTGWQQVRITRGLEQLAGTFTLDMTDKWSIDSAAPRVREGMACQVLIAGQPVITGWIDEAGVEYDSENHLLRVRGRDRAGDLVDCAAIHAGQEWKGRDLAQVAADLLRPFGMRVRVETDIGAPFRYTHAEPGDTVHELLDRGARMRGVLLVSDSGTGDLVLTRAGQARATTPLRLGENIFAGSSQRSQRDRFSLYRVLGQQRETDNLDPEQAATSAAEVRDTGVTRYRPTVVMADGAADIGECQARARWERSTRAGQGIRATVSVRGWLDNGVPWQPNTLADALDPWCGLDGEYLIAGVEYGIDNSEGSVTHITVVPPGAYDVLAEKETNPAGAAGADGGDGNDVVFGSALTLPALEEGAA